MGIVGSCLGSCCASMGCTCIEKSCGGCRSRTGSLIPYMVLFVLATLLALFLRYLGKPLLIDLYIYHIDVCTSDKCVGIGGVDRISFSLFLFFLFHALLVKFSSPTLDRGSWLTKILAFICLLIGAWLIPNAFYTYYMHVSRIVSILFLLLQIVILVDFAYALNESWTDESNPKHTAVLAVSGLCYAACITVAALTFVYFGSVGSNDCALQNFFISFTIVATTMMSVLSISNVIESGGGLLPAAIVSLYCFWLLFTALTSDPSSCNSISSRSSAVLPVVFGCVISALSIGYASWSVASSSVLGPVDTEETKALANKQEELLSDDHKRDDVESAGSPHDVEMRDGSSSARAGAIRRLAPTTLKADEHVAPPSQAAVTRSYRFHLLMSTAAMYMCMLLSNWGTGATSDDDDYDLNVVNMWIKISTQWITMLMYTWSLIAPIVCKNRDFS